MFFFFPVRWTSTRDKVTDPLQSDWCTAAAEKQAEQRGVQRGERDGFIWGMQMWGSGWWGAGSSPDVSMRAFALWKHARLKCSPLLRPLCSGQVAVLGCDCMQVVYPPIVCSLTETLGLFSRRVKRARMHSGRRAAPLCLQPTHRCNSLEELSAQPTHAQSSRFYR